METDNIIFFLGISFLGIYIALIVYNLFAYMGRQKKKVHVIYIGVLISMVLFVLANSFFPILYPYLDPGLVKILWIFRYIAIILSLTAISVFTMSVLSFPEFVKQLKKLLIFLILIPHVVAILIYALTEDYNLVYYFIIFPVCFIFSIIYFVKLMSIFFIPNLWGTVLSWQRTSLYGFLTYIVAFVTYGVIRFFNGPEFWKFVVINIGFLVHAVFSAYAFARQFNKTHQDLKSLKKELELTVSERTNQLKAANRQIVKQNQERTTFFINLAHELKTPVTLIDNFIDRYDSDKGTPEDFQIIKRNFHKLKRDVVNFLDLEKLSRGQIYYNHNQVVDVKIFLEEKISLFTGEAVKKEIFLTYKVSDDTLFAAIDPFAFDRIVNNLLENALRYTPNGGEVSLEAAIKGSRIVLTLADSGIGIAPDRLENIFDPYYQITHEKRNSQGMGMGLSIVKQIIDQVEGDISVSSQLGDGSVFSVSLPSVASDTPISDSYKEYVSKPAAVHEHQQIIREDFYKEKHTLLIVEDSPDMLSLLACNFQDEYNIFLSKNGREALEVLSSMPVKPDCIISDIMMDEMDGLELYEKVSKDLGLGSIPFIFITARLDAGDKVRALSLGAVDFILKPFVMDELTFKVKSVLSLVERNLKNKKKEVLDEISRVLDSQPVISVQKTDGDFDSLIEPFGLSKREKAIARLVAQGLQNKEIAGEMGVAIRTVDSHIYNIFRKTGCSNRTEFAKMVQ